MILLAIAATVVLAPGEILVLGAGNSSCAEMTEADRRSQERDWITGFWSGLNLLNKKQVGANTDVPGVLAEVDSLCRSEPSLLLGIATLKTYRKLEAAGR